MQPPRRRHRQLCHFGDNGTQTAVPDPFLETGEHRLLVAGFDVDNPLRTETRLSQGRGKEVLPCEAPEDLTFGARSYAGGEQCGGGAINRAVAASRNFMQRSQQQTAVRQSTVNLRNAKRKRGSSPGSLTFQHPDAPAQVVDDRFFHRPMHSSKTRQLDYCS